MYTHTHKSTPRLQVENAPRLSVANCFSNLFLYLYGRLPYQQGLCEAAARLGYQS